MKITCTSLVMLVTLMFGFHIGEKQKQKQKQKLPDLISACDSLLNENVSFLKQIMMSNEKWTMYNKVEWKRFQSKWNKQPQTTSKPSRNPNRNQPWIFIGRTNAETGASILWPPNVKSQI